MECKIIEYFIIFTITISLFGRKSFSKLQVEMLSFCLFNYVDIFAGMRRKCVSYNIGLLYFSIISGYDDYWCLFFFVVTSAKFLFQFVESQTNLQDRVQPREHFVLTPKFFKSFYIGIKL